MLERIVAATREAVVLAKREKDLSELRTGLSLGNFAFSTALRAKKWALIAECKLASPAKGTLCSTYNVPELAAKFAANGAAALSIHTNACFNGSLVDIVKVKQMVTLPVLCKEFIIDPYQIYAARRAGADAILLIAAILSDAEMLKLYSLAEKIGMDCLVEVHTHEELMRVQKLGVRLIGINNRDLNTFSTNIEQTFTLLSGCKPDQIIISESGIKSREEVLRLKAAGVHGVLVGEGLVTAPDIAAKTSELALTCLKNYGGEVENA